MGNRQSQSHGLIHASGVLPSSRTSTAEENVVVRQKPIKEKSRYGSVHVSISLPQNAITRSRAPRGNIPEQYTITSRGSILHGTQSDPSTIQRALAASERPLLEPSEIPIPDSRAHKVLVTHIDKWYAIPAPEVFSRHSGTCLILGDRTHTSPPYSLKLGDCFRFGSVGLVVTEMKLEGGEVRRLDSSIVQFLKDEALAFDSEGDMAALAMDESALENSTVLDDSLGPSALEQSVGSECMTDRNTDMTESPSRRCTGMAMGERFICYMCYETHDTADDPLVAPCDCRGDTRYLHVQCLQKWYQASMNTHQPVIRITGSGAPACKICGGAYKTTFKKADGSKASLLELDDLGPFCCMVVVTRHDTNPALFNTKFRLNFNRTSARQGRDDLGIDISQPIMIGRSTTCGMVLDYRTVSTVHAKMYFQDGQFLVQDKRSSNGTMVYLQDPQPLSFSHPTRLRMGRSTLVLQARRSWIGSLRSMSARMTGRTDSANGLTPSGLVALMAAHNVSTGPTKSRNSKKHSSPRATSPSNSLAADDGDSKRHQYDEGYMEEQSRRVNDDDYEGVLDHEIAEAASEEADMDAMASLEIAADRRDGKMHAIKVLDFSGTLRSSHTRNEDSSRSIASTSHANLILEDHSMAQAAYEGSHPAVVDRESISTTVPAAGAFSTPTRKSSPGTRQLSD